MKQKQLRWLASIARRAVVPPSCARGGKSFREPQPSRSPMDPPLYGPCSCCGRPAPGRSCCASLKHHLRHWWNAMDVKRRQLASLKVVPHGEVL